MTTLPRPIRAFSLIEMLVSMAVLALLILMVTQIMNGATKTTGLSRQRLEADSEARMVFDRMADDFANIVNRKDVDFIFDGPTVTGTGNGVAYFYSEAPAITSAKATVADPAQPVALVGYRINTDYQLERLGKGLTWGGAPPDGAVFLTYPSTPAPAGGPTPAPSPDQESTLKGTEFSKIINAATKAPGSAYHVLGENVFRLQFSFLLKPYTDLTGTAQPATYSDSRFNANHNTVDKQIGIGLSDVQAIVVTLALLDARSRKLIAGPTALAGIVNSPFAGTADPTTLPAEKWETNINNLSGAGIPQVAAAQIRIYQRMFFLNSGVN